MLLKHTKYTPASGPLHSLLLLPSTSYPRHSHGRLFIIQVFSQTSPPQRGVPWPLFSVFKVTPFTRLYFVLGILPAPCWQIQ